jgi:hypothetical protein
MNSMMQQLYMIPQFRYGILEAINPEPENIVEHKERKINDNLLFQLQ